MPVPEQLLNWNRAKWESKNEDMYASQQENTWAWYNDGLDPDVGQFVRQLPAECLSILDLGTCSGSQAVGLAQLGHDVIGSDVSASALEQAENTRSELNDPTLKLSFVLDDIIESQFSDDQFDLMFDRGCYHSICCFAHSEYIRQVKRLLRPNGHLLLKTMSASEPRFSGHETLGGQRLPMPFKFEAPQLASLFDEHFEIVSISDSFFYSATTKPPAQALLAVLKHSGK